MPRDSKRSISGSNRYAITKASASGVSAARVGMATVDVGSPMLSMHSCREMAGSADVAPMIDVLALFLSEGAG